MTKKSVLMLLAAAALAANMPLFAQISQANVTGIVRDPAGASVPQAVVTLRNMETSVARKTETNTTGNYVVLNVAPGQYTVEVSKPGFSVTKVEPFTLMVNQTATVDLTLKVGAVSDSVTVAAVGAEVQAATAELGAAVTERQVVELPLNGRNFTQLLALTPGVSPVNVSQAGRTNPVGSFVLPSVNGQTNRSNFFMLDGIANQQAVWSTYAAAPVVDGIEEFKVQSHNDQAEVGGVLGGVVNVVTKSGTNQLHGSAWEFMRNDAFDARNTFRTSVTPFKQNMFGGAVGGPVYIPKLYNGKNRTFFYATYQGFRYRRPAQSYLRVPTAANLTGDLSDWPKQIFNPYTTRVDPNKAGAFIRDPFPGNKIPTSMINPGMVLYAKTVLPSPTVTPLPDRNAMDDTQVRNGQEEYSARVDQNLGTKDVIWFRFSGRQYDGSGSGGFPALASMDINHSYNLGTSWLHTFGPSSVLQVQFGNVQVDTTSGTRFRSLPANFVKDIGVSPNACCNFIYGGTLVPTLNVADYFSAGENINPVHPSDIQQYKANYTKVVGKHSFKAGGELSSSHFWSSISNWNMAFQTTQTADPQNQGTTGSGLASYLLGIPNSAGQRNAVVTMGWGGVMGFYVQDQWKATPKLTVNLGLRYDRSFMPRLGTEGNPNEEIGNMDFNRGVYVLQKLSKPCEVTGKAPCIPTSGGVLPANVVVDTRGRFLDDTTKNFQPRVGLAYRLRSTTAIRASFGVYFDNWAGIIQTGQNISSTWPSIGEQSATNLNLPSATQLVPTVTVQNPSLGGTVPPASPFASNNYYYDPNYKNPYSLQWNFGVQHQINGSTVLTANYVGSGSRRLDLGGLYNTATTPGPGNTRDRALFPYIGVTNYQRSWGRSNYNALQALLERRFARGFAGTVSYTWSKSIDIGCSGFFGAEGCNIQDPYHFNTSRSVSAFDVPHMLTFNWVYELPVGKGKALQTGNKAADYVIGNWQVNGITTLRSGNPYTLTVSGDIANIGNTFVRPNVVGDWKISNPSTAAWFNTSAFATPAQYTFGNLGRNRLRTDWVRNLDLSAFRRFPFGERRYMEFRAEAFNALNMVVYGTPVTGLQSSTFGRVLGTGNTERNLQLALKISF